MVWTRMKHDKVVTTTGEYEAVRMFERERGKAKWSLL